MRTQDTRCRLNRARRIIESLIREEARWDDNLESEVNEALSEIDFKAELGYAVELIDNAIAEICTSVTDGLLETHGVDISDKEYDELRDDKVKKLVTKKVLSVLTADFS